VAPGAVPSAQVLDGFHAAFRLDQHTPAVFRRDLRTDASRRASNHPGRCAPDVRAVQPDHTRQIAFPRLIERPIIGAICISIAGILLDDPI